MNHYSNAEVFQLGDSGASIMTEGSFAESLSPWNAEAVFPAFIPELDPSKVAIRDHDWLIEIVASTT